MSEMRRMTAASSARLAIVAAFVVAAFSVLFLRSDWSVVTMMAENPTSMKTTSTTKSNKADGGARNERSFHISPGELPGYTGWARPDSTLAGDFEIVEPFPSEALLAGEEWVVTIRGPSDSAWFYVRAYGPAIITGTAQSLGSGSYKIALRPVDPGMYTVEVVLTFSQTPAIEAFPIPRDASIHAPFYEGYLLPNFPFLLSVQGSLPPDASTLPYCALQDLRLSDVKKPPAARWRVIDSVRSSLHQKTAPAVDSSTISLAKYQHSYSSLGIRAVYEFEKCNLMTTTKSDDPKGSPLKQCLTETNTEVILIGDSTMELQKNMLVSLGTGVQVSFYELYGGVLRSDRLSGPKLSDITWNDAVKNRVVVFNTGLHDIHRLCGDEWNQDRQKYLTPDELDLPCIQLYQKALELLLERVNQIPAAVTIFQTTTAAWPKYGNYGIAWDPTAGQALPLEAGFVTYFNSLAFDVARRVMRDNNNKDILVADGFWNTLTRPDHREIDAKVHIGKKLAHPGPEVVKAMVNIWSMMIVRSLCTSMF